LSWLRRGSIVLVAAIIAASAVSCTSRPKSLDISVENQLDGSSLDAVIVQDPKGPIARITVPSGSTVHAVLTTVSAGSDGDRLYLSSPADGPQKYEITPGFEGALTGKVSVILSGVSSKGLLEGAVHREIGGSSGWSGLYVRGY